MPLSGDIHKSLNDRNRNMKNCTFCGSNNWIVNERLFASVPLDTDGTLKIDREGGIQPVVILKCNNCGLIYYFDPMVLGVMDSTVNNQ